MCGAFYVITIYTCKSSSCVVFSMLLLYILVNHLHVWCFLCYYSIYIYTHTITLLLLLLLLLSLLLLLLSLLLWFNPLFVMASICGSRNAGAKATARDAISKAPWPCYQPCLRSRQRCGALLGFPQWIGRQNMGGFHSHGCTLIAGWFIVENPYL